MNIPLNLKVLVIHCASDRSRVINVNRLKKIYGNRLSVLNAIDASQHDKYVKDIVTKCKIPIHMPHLQKRSIGSFCCWLSFACAVKYVYDVFDDNTPVLILEDDTIIPDNFEYKPNLWKERGVWYKLSQWNEANIIDKNTASRFLKALYTRPICWDLADRWVMDYMQPVYLKKHWGGCEQLKLLAPTNDGVIKMSPKKVHQYKWNIPRYDNAEDPSGLFRKKIFKLSPNPSIIKSIIN